MTITTLEILMCLLSFVMILLAIRCIHEVSGNRYRINRIMGHLGVGFFPPFKTPPAPRPYHKLKEAPSKPVRVEKMVITSKAELEIQVNRILQDIDSRFLKDDKEPKENTFLRIINRVFETLDKGETMRILNGNHNTLKAIIDKWHDGTYHVYEIKY